MGPNKKGAAFLCLLLCFTADTTVGRGRGMVEVWNACRGIFWIYVDSSKGQGSLPVLRATMSVLAVPSFVRSSSQQLTMTCSHLFPIEAKFEVP